tara:strand:+ start:1399 stop:1899 length:501 start_codon:yes stop_codon:yes gene_type:complete
MVDVNTIPKELIKLYDKLPHFEDGRINYTNADKALAVNAVVKYKENVLLLKRSDKVYVAKNKWCIVAGHYDGLVSILDECLKELGEETGISKESVLKASSAEPFDFFEQEINRTFCVYPVLLELKEQLNPKLNWEHTEARWVDKKELKNYEIPPSTKIVFERLNLL